MRTTIAALAAVLLLGFVCAGVSYRLYGMVGRPDLLVQVVRGGDNADSRIIRLANVKDVARRIDRAGLEYFLYTPSGDSGRRVVYIQARQFFLNPRDRLERETGAYALKPGEIADIKDVSILLRGVPVAAGDRLGAILACYPPLDGNEYWRGFLRSAFIPEGHPPQ
jgi:hypothetical protein